MRLAPGDSAQLNGRRQDGIERIRDVVLSELSSAEAGDIEVAVVERQIDVGDEWRNSLEALEKGRQQFGIGRLGGEVDPPADLPGAFSLFPMPQPHEGGGGLL